MALVTPLERVRNGSVACCPHRSRTTDTQRTRAEDAEHEPWAPLSVDQVAALFRDAPFPWWVAGGWAIDLFVGRQTRSHGDIEIAVLRRDHLAARDVLRGWDLHAAEGQLFPWPPGEPLKPEWDNVWGRPSPDVPWALQVLIEEAEGNTWRYRRDPRITRPLAQFGRRDARGVPYVAPEVQLLYKAKGRRPRDEADLEVTLPLLDADGVRWLAASLAAQDARHPWLARLRERTSQPGA